MNQAARTPLEEIDAAIAERLLAAALGSGGDYADLYFEYRSGADFVFEEGRVRTVGRGVTLGLGYNRRFHPEMGKLRGRIDSGELGVVMHVEATMTFPNALLLQPAQWRAQRDETPCGGLTPMGVHAVDGMIDLCGPIEQVYPHFGFTPEKVAEAARSVL